MQSDVAHSDSLFLFGAWLDKNKKQVSIGAVAVIVVGLLAWLILWQKDQKQVAAGEALSNVAVGQFGMGGQRQGVADAYMKVAADFPSSSAAGRALLMAGGTLFTEGKYDEARGQFQKFVQDHRDSPFFGQALLGIASSYDAQGNAAQAMTAYKDLIDHHPNDIVIPQAKFALASLYAAQDKPEQARNYYEEVMQVDRYGILGDESMLRLRELLTKYPALAPKPPTSALAPVPAASATPLTLEKK